MSLWVQFKYLDIWDLSRLGSCVFTDLVHKNILLTQLLRVYFNIYLEFSSWINYTINNTWNMQL